MTGPSVNARSRARAPVAAPAPLSIRLLGPVEVLVDGRPISVDTRKAIALLAFLAAGDARPATRESLAALLWPDAGDGDARGALRRTLSVLNAALDPGRLLIDRRTVGLAAASLDVDIGRFETLVGRARGHGHSPDLVCRECRVALESAVALDRGEFMAGFTLRDSEPWDEWQLGRAESQRRELTGALERLARSARAERDWPRATSIARRWLEIDALHEPAHRLLIEAYARAGEPAAAIQQFRTCVRILDAELGVPPLPETAALYEAVRQGSVSSEAPPETAQAAGTGDGTPQPSQTDRARPLPLVGRAGELARLTTAYGEVRRGSGLVCLVTGEAGIGKTRLIDALADVVSGRGGPVLAARGRRGEHGIAFGLIVELLRSAVADPDMADRLATLDPVARRALGRLTPLTGVGGGQGAAAVSFATRGPETGPSARHVLMEAIGDALALAAAGDPPGLVRIDDLQWADVSSLEALGFLGRRLETRPLLLVLAWRPEDAAEAGAALGDLAHLPGALAIELERLDRAAVHELVGAALGSASTVVVGEGLFQESEGLPLYLVEALAAGDSRSGAVPYGVQALLEERLSAVGEVAAQVLAAAAVVGRSFDPELVRQASGRSDDEVVVALEELGQRGLVREVGQEPANERYDFSHSLLQEAAYARLSLARRRLLNRRVAEALRMGLGPQDERSRLSLVASHERAAGREAEAADAYASAGELARSVFANREALASLEAALALGHPDHAGLQEAIGDLQTRLGDYRSALTALEAAAATATGERLGSIERRLGLIHLRRGDLASADSHLRAAIEALGPVGTPASRSAVLADRSVVAYRSGEADRAIALARDALTIAEEASDTVAAAVAHRLLGLVARKNGDLGRARSELEQSATLAAEAHDTDAIVAAAHALALVELAAGAHFPAEEHARAALAGATRMGDRHIEAAIENTLADILHAAGREEDSMDHLRRAVVLFADIGESPRGLDPEIWKLVEW